MSNMLDKFEHCSSSILQLSDKLNEGQTGILQMET